MKVLKSLKILLTVVFSQGTFHLLTQWTNRLVEVSSPCRKFMQVIRVFLRETAPPGGRCWSARKRHQSELVEAKPGVVDIP